MFAISKEKHIPVEEYSHIFQQNVDKVVGSLKQEKEVAARSLILLEGSETIPINDEDTEYIDFYQNGHFMYLFGLEQRDLFGVIEVDSGRQVVFIPRLPESYRLWMIVKSKEEFAKEHNVSTYYTDEFESYLKDYAPSMIYLNDGVNSDSGRRPVDLNQHASLGTAIAGYPQNKSDLFEVMSECRVNKSNDEINLMSWVTQLSCEAHVEMMKGTKAGMKEYQLSAMFIAYVKNHSAGLFGYGPICAGGTNAAVLHYINNDQTLQDGQLVLTDQGGKWKGYTADITVTYPVNGVFSPKQKEIYNAVLDANLQVFQQCKPGVKWDDMHRLAENVLVSHLQKIGIVKSGFSLEELEEKRVGAVFMPHGLGHLIGLAIHDVGGYAPCCPPRRAEQGFNKLRTRRELSENMCLTIEPGCYFIEHILSEARQSEIQKECINWEKVEEYKSVGGVRIEDDVYISASGCVNMSADLPRSVEQIEACLAGKEWRNI